MRRLNISEEQKAGGQEGRLVNSGKLKVESGKLTLEADNSSPNQGRLGGVLTMQNSSKSIPTPILPNQGGSKRKCAFTLAEVLVTLGVIGVIAAMTLPSVIKNYQKQVTVNRLKESYNTLSQAFQRAVVEHDAPAYWTYDDNNLDFFVETYIAPYVKIIKKSSTAPTHYNIDSKTEMYYYRYYNHYYLANGTEFTVYKIPELVNTHYFIDIDINGIKGPNKYGRDVFRTQFLKTTKTLSLAKTFVFNGVNNSFSDIKTGCKSNGNYCGGWIVREGWKIPDDYPW